jgi:choline-glycine betaine transporter
MIYPWFGQASNGFLLHVVKIVQLAWSLFQLAPRLKIITIVISQYFHYHFMIYNNPEALHNPDLEALRTSAQSEWS